MARTPLITPTTFYADAILGSDLTGNGLTVATAWKTINHGRAVIAADYDLCGVGGHKLKLYPTPDGVQRVYKEGVTWDHALCGQRNVFIIEGDPSDPSHVKVLPQAGQGNPFAISHGGDIYLVGMCLEGKDSGPTVDDLVVGERGAAAYSSLWFGWPGQGTGAGDGGHALVCSESGSLKIVGGTGIYGLGGQGFMTCGTNARIVFLNDAQDPLHNPVQIALLGNVSWTTGWANANDGGVIQFTNVPTDYGGWWAAGPKFCLRAGSILNTACGGANLPGTGPGYNDGTSLLI